MLKERLEPNEFGGPFRLNSAVAVSVGVSILAAIASVAIHDQSSIGLGHGYGVIVSSVAAVINVVLAIIWFQRAPRSEATVARNSALAISHHHRTVRTHVSDRY